MPVDTVSDQSRQSGAGVAVEDAASGGAQAAGRDEQARPHAAAEDDPQPSAPETAPNSSESEGQAGPKLPASPKVESPAAPNGGSPSPSRGDESASLKAGESVFTPRQVGTAAKFGFSQEDLVVLEALGRTGKSLLDRLVKADSEIGRRYSRLGREEQISDCGLRIADSQEQRDRGPGTGDRERPNPQSASDAPAPEAPDASKEVERLQGEVARLAREAQESKAARDTALAAREAAEAERFFARLDAEEFPQFGRGLSADLQEGSSQRRSREELLTKAAEIRRGHAAVQGREMDVEESLRQALAVVAPDASAQAQRRRLARQLRLRSAGLISRPAQRRGGTDLESPADRTARALEEWQGRRGVRFFED